MKKKSGFTLVELAIVLVIIGLIVAGVVAGQGLVEQAKFRSLKTDIDKFNAAINLFEVRYEAIPGDITNAYDYWGSQNSCTDSTVASGNQAGCNGNGDGAVEWFTEGFRAWQHLALAELIEGSYTGIATTGSPNFTLEVGVTVPASPFVNIGYALRTVSNNDLQVATGAPPVASATPIDPNLSFTPREAYSLDSKYDDGNADSGQITAGGSVGASECKDSNGNYSLTHSNLRCLIYFSMR